MEEDPKRTAEATKIPLVSSIFRADVQIGQLAALVGESLKFLITELAKSLGTQMGKDAAAAISSGLSAWWNGTTTSPLLSGRDQLQIASSAITSYSGAATAVTLESHITTNLKLIGTEFFAGGQGQVPFPRDVGPGGGFVKDAPGTDAEGVAVYAFGDLSSSTNCVVLIIGWRNPKVFSNKVLVKLLLRRDYNEMTNNGTDLSSLQTLLSNSGYTSKSSSGIYTAEGKTTESPVFGGKLFVATAIYQTSIINKTFKPWPDSYFQMWNLTNVKSEL